MPGARDSDEQRPAWTRWIVLLAAVVCLLFVGTLRDVPTRWLGAELASVPAVPSAVSERPAVVSLTVLDAKGAPVAGADVRVFSLIEDRAYIAARGRSDAAGKARLADLPAGETWLIVERSGHARASSRVVLSAGERVLELRLVDAHQFEVVVVDPMQRPVRGVTVSLYGSDPLPRQVRTDATGLALIDSLGPAPYAVEIDVPGYDHTFLPRLTAADSPLFIRLERLGGLQVVVLGLDGQPVEGATVVVAGSSLWPARSALTDRSGRVSIAGLPRGFYDLVARKEQLVSSASDGVLLERGENKQIELRLIEGRRITVRVTDGEGDDAPVVAGADVALAEGGISSFPIYGRTNDKGVVVLGPVAGDDVTVSAQAEGFVPRAAVPLEEDRDEVQVALLKGGKIVGRVVDDRGFPIDGAQLEVVGIDLHGMPLVESRALAGFRQDHFAFALPGATPLMPAGELGVMAMVPDIPPAQGALLVARRRHGGTPWVSRSDGGFELSPVPPGRVRVVARHPRFVEAISETLKLTPGGQVEVVLVLRRGGSLEGRVVEANRSPASGARIEIAAVVGSLERITYAADDGSFAFASLPDEVIVSVSRADAPEHIVHRSVVAIEEDQRKEIEIVLPDTRQEVTLRVADDRGYPIERVEVRATSLDPDEPLWRTVFTGPAGEAILPEARGLPLRLVWRRSGRGPGVLQVERAPRQLELTMPEALGLVGEVYGRDGPLADAEVTLLTATGAHRQRSEDSGKFVFKDLSPSVAQMLILASGYAPEEREIELAAERGEPMDLGRIELTQGGAVTGKVVDDLDEPVAGARVALGRVPTYLPLGALPPGIALTRRDGSFVLPDLPPGKQAIEALLIGFGRDGADVTVRAGETVDDVRIVLREASEDAGGGLEGAGSLAVTLGEEGGAIIFDHVPLSGEAQRAGILPGDRLLSFNGLTVRSLGRARRLLTGPLSEDFVLHLSRPPDLEWSVRVKRERLRR